MLIQPHQIRNQNHRPQQQQKHPDQLQVEQIHQHRPDVVRKAPTPARHQHLQARLIKRLGKINHSLPLRRHAQRPHPHIRLLVLHRIDDLLRRPHHRHLILQPRLPRQLIPKLRRIPHPTPLLHKRKRLQIPRHHPNLPRRHRLLPRNLRHQKPRPKAAQNQNSNQFTHPQPNSTTPPKSTPSSLPFVPLRETRAPHPPPQTPHRTETRCTMILAFPFVESFTLAMIFTGLPK